jgi:hypothetical protein
LAFLSFSFLLVAGGGVGLEGWGEADVVGLVADLVTFCVLFLGSE